MEEWEEWEFVRTSTDEEDRCARHTLTLAAIDRILGRKSCVARAAPAAAARPVAMCPTATIVMNTNNENRRLGVPVKGDPRVNATAFEKRAYTPADARADRERWLANAKRISGR